MRRYGRAGVQAVATDVAAAFSHEQGSTLLNQFYQEYLQHKKIKAREIRHAAALLPGALAASAWKGKASLHACRLPLTSGQLA